MLQNMGSAGWAAFPEGTTLELKEAGHGSDRTPQGDLLTRADQYVRLLILGQTMTGATLASGRGGQSFGTVEAQLKQDRLDAASFFVANVFNRQLIPYILLLNYGDIDEAPSCRFLKETEGTYQDAQRDQILTTMGLQIPLSHLRHKYAIPEATGDDPTTTAPPKPTAPSSVTPGPAGTRPLGEPSKNPAPNPKEVAAKLEAFSMIQDDELWARELRTLASELVTGYDPSEPRAPAGTHEGGEWTSEGGTPAKKKTPKDVSTMSASEINKELDKLDEKSSAVTDEFIQQGRGYEKSFDILKQNDPLSQKYQEIR
jgi:hypothetical protein